MKRATKPMRQASPALAKRRREYSKRRLIFLDKPENRVCPVGRIGLISCEWTTEIHHTDGREGRLLLDESKWLAVSRAGHDWIHNHPNEARKHGWLV